MIKLLGTLKRVGLKSSVSDHGETIHQVSLQFEMIEGVDRIQDVVSQLKSIVEVSLDSKQPSLLKGK